MVLPDQEGPTQRPNDGVRQTQSTTHDHTDDQSVFFGKDGRRNPSEGNRAKSGDDAGDADGASRDADDGYYNREQFNRSQFGAPSYRRDSSGDLGRMPRTFRSRGDRPDRDSRSRSPRTNDDRPRGSAQRSDRDSGHQPRSQYGGAPYGNRRSDGGTQPRYRDGGTGGPDRRGRYDGPSRDGGRRFGAPSTSQSRGYDHGKPSKREKPLGKGGRPGPSRRRFDADGAAAGLGRKTRGGNRTQPQNVPKTTLVKSLVSFQWASRAVSLKAILDGRVSVNERTLIHPNVRVKPDTDVLQIDGNVLLRKSAKPITIVFHKPSGLPGSREEGRPNLYSTLANRNGWFMPLGSLTKAAAGIVVLSNDPIHKRAVDSPIATLTSDLMIKVHRNPKKTEITKLKKLLGAAWPGDAAVLDVIHHAKGSRAGWIRITHRTGKIRDVMVAMKSLQLEPLRVMRSRVGPFSIESIKAGAWYRLSDHDVLALDELAKQHPENDNVSLSKIWEQISATIFRQ